MEFKRENKKKRRKTVHNPTILIQWLKTLTHFCLLLSIHCTWLHLRGYQASRHLGKTPFHQTSLPPETCVFSAFETNRTQPITPFTPAKVCKPVSPGIWSGKPHHWAATPQCPKAFHSVLRTHGPSSAESSLSKLWTFSSLSCSKSKPGYSFGYRFLCCFLPLPSATGLWGDLRSWPPYSFMSVILLSNLPLLIKSCCQHTSPL